MGGRKDQKPISTVSYDWDTEVKEPDDADVAEYRAIEMETKYPAAELMPWDTIPDSFKQVWRHRYKHGS